MTTKETSLSRSPPREVAKSPPYKSVVNLVNQQPLEEDTKSDLSLLMEVVKKERRVTRVRAVRLESGQLSYSIDKQTRTELDGQVGDSPRLRERMRQDSQIRDYLPRASAGENKAEKQPAAKGANEGNRKQRQRDKRRRNREKKRNEKKDAATVSNGPARVASDDAPREQTGEDKPPVLERVITSVTRRALPKVMLSQVRLAQQPIDYETVSVTSLAPIINQPTPAGKYGTAVASADSASEGKPEISLESEAKVSTILPDNKSPPSSLTSLVLRLPADLRPMVSSIKSPSTSMPAKSDKVESANMVIPMAPSDTSQPDSLPVDVKDSQADKSSNLSPQMKASEPVASPAGQVKAIVEIFNSKSAKEAFVTPKTDQEAVTPNNKEAASKIDTSTEETKVVVSKVLFPSDSQSTSSPAHTISDALPISKPSHSPDSLGTSAQSRPYLSAKSTASEVATVCTKVQSFAPSESASQKTANESKPVVLENVITSTFKTTPPKVEESQIGLNSQQASPSACREGESVPVTLSKVPTESAIPSTKSTASELPTVSTEVQSEQPVVLEKVTTSTLNTTPPKVKEGPIGLTSQQVKGESVPVAPSETESCIPSTNVREQSSPAESNRSAVGSVGASEVATPSKVKEGQIGLTSQQASSSACSEIESVPVAPTMVPTESSIPSTKSTANEVATVSTEVQSEKSLAPNENAAHESKPVVVEEVTTSTLKTNPSKVKEGPIGLTLQQVVGESVPVTHSETGSSNIREQPPPAETYRSTVSSVGASELPTVSTGIPCEQSLAPNEKASQESANESKPVVLEEVITSTPMTTPSKVEEGQIGLTSQQVEGESVPVSPSPSETESSNVRKQPSPVESVVGSVGASEVATPSKVKEGPIGLTSQQIVGESVPVAPTPSETESSIPSTKIGEQPSPAESYRSAVNSADATSQCKSLASFQQESVVSAIVPDMEARKPLSLASQKSTQESKSLTKRPNAASLMTVTAETMPDQFLTPVLAAVKSPPSSPTSMVFRMPASLRGKFAVSIGPGPSSQSSGYTSAKSEANSPGAELKSQPTMPKKAQSPESGSESQLVVAPQQTESLLESRLPQSASDQVTISTSGEMAAVNLVESNPNQVLVVSSDIKPTKPQVCDRPFETALSSNESFAPQNKSSKDLQRVRSARDLAQFSQEEINFLVNEIYKPVTEEMTGAEPKNTQQLQLPPTEPDMVLVQSSAPNLGKAPQTVAAPFETVSHPKEDIPVEQKVSSTALNKAAATLKVSSSTLLLPEPTGDAEVDELMRQIATRGDGKIKLAGPCTENPHTHFYRQQEHFLQEVISTSFTNGIREQLGGSDLVAPPIKDESQLIECQQRLMEHEKGYLKHVHGQAGEKHDSSMQCRECGKTPAAAIIPAAPEAQTETDDGLLNGQWLLLMAYAVFITFLLLAKLF